MLELQLACPLVQKYLTDIQVSTTGMIHKHNKLLYQPLYTKMEGENTVICKGALRAMEWKTAPTGVQEVFEVTTEEAFTHPVVLPLALRQPLMRFLHDENAHPGATRLLASCQLKYWWRGMTTYITEYATKCQHCKKRNLSHKVATPPLQRYPPVSRPFQRCHMDLIELPLTASKYRYILVIKCAFTKWIEMVILPQPPTTHKVMEP